MARWGADAVYEAAELFRKRCLVDGTSLLWPEHRSWSVETIDSLLQSLGDDPGEGTSASMKRRQLSTSYGSASPLSAPRANSSKKARCAGRPVR